MKKILIITFITTIIIIAVIIKDVYSETITEKDCFFLTSLHYTTNGQRYWYSQENGGLEQLTGIPYDDLACQKCHTASCDDCHGTEIVKQVKKGKITLTWLKNDKIQNLKGVIPVVTGVDYQCVYMDYQKQKWLPIKNHDPEFIITRASERHFQKSNSKVWPKIKAFLNSNNNVTQFN